MAGPWNFVWPILTVICMGSVLFWAFVFKTLVETPGRSGLKSLLALLFSACLIASILTANAALHYFYLLPPGPREVVDAEFPQLPRHDLDTISNLHLEYHAPVGRYPRSGYYFLSFNAPPKTLELLTKNFKKSSEDELRDKLAHISPPAWWHPNADQHAEYYKDTRPGGVFQDAIFYMITDVQTGDTFVFCRAVDRG